MIAAVVIGGLITFTLLTAFVVLEIYPWFAPVQSADHDQADGIAG
jgi:Cu/Ag efflux pump CusA